MTVALESAFAIGITITEFWTITPHQLAVAERAYAQKFEVEYNIAAVMMYNNALLSRTQKRLPHLKTFLYQGNKGVKGIDEAAIMERFKAYNAQLEVTDDANS